MGKAVTRHLTYAWIEYGDPREGAAFTDGLFSMGWKNVARGFPVKRDSFGVRYVDSAHPLLPIRFRGSGLLILPNEKIDKHGHDKNPPVKDPIFVEFRNANGEERFNEEIIKQNRFISQWVFCPGIKRVSDTESRLTVDADITDYVDLAAISGHGAAGLVWGGGESARVAEALFFPLTPASDRLKYVVIASCFNVAKFAADAWLPALRRNNPVHGILGFGTGYPGDEVGQSIFRNFTNNLKAGGGSQNTILKAWREAHAGAHSKIWAALMHVSSAKNDTMSKWLAGKIETPSKDGEVRWYSEENYPDGEIFIAPDPDPAVNFFMGATKITSRNTADPKIGLFPGQKGSLTIVTKPPAFAVGDVLKIVFFYYRDDKPGMDLNKLLTFDPAENADVTLLTDENKRDTTTFVDGLQVVVKAPGLLEIKLPFTVRPDAAKNFPNDGTVHGYFNLLLNDKSHFLGQRFYREGAWLRENPP
jgi:hypothetical protein